MLKDFALPSSLTLRSSAAGDGAFLEGLFRSTRGHFYSMPMPRQHIDLLLAQQYRLQQDSYTREWPAAQTLVIELSGAVIGKIMLDESGAGVHIIDFVLEPGARGKGYGTAILEALQTAAGERRIMLSVDRQNPAARRLYLSLGFQVDAASDTHEALIWAPSGFQQATG